jgi:hypothetical protein
MRYLYVLSDPRSGDRYVGETANPPRRLYQHSIGIGCNQTRDWCLELRAAGLEPTMRVVQVITPQAGEPTKGPGSLRARARRAENETRIELGL